MDIVEELRQQEKEGYINTRISTNSSSQISQEIPREKSGSYDKLKRYFDNANNKIKIKDK